VFCGDMAGSFPNEKARAAVAGGLVVSPNEKPGLGDRVI
jgi:hypothetical protein